MGNPVTELMSDGLSAPLGEVIAAVGRGVAEAQAALDAASIKATLDVYAEDGDAGTALLREIGYQPTFYVLPETSCEVQVSMRVGGSGGADGSASNVVNTQLAGRARTYVTPVDAGFQQRYSFLAQAAAKLTFKIVPVPPPSALDNSRQIPDFTAERTAVEDAVARLQRLGLAAELINASGERLDAAAALQGLVVIAQAAPAHSLQPVGTVIALTVG